MSIYKHLSFKNHIKYFLDGNLFGNRSTTREVLSEEFGTCSRKVFSWRDECIESARIISNLSPEIPTIFFSGGIDSEVILLSFLEKELPFKTVIVSYENSLNSHDIVYAIKFCQKRDIEFTVLNIDVKKIFTSGEYLDIAAITKCVSPMMIPMMKVLKEFKGFPVLGSGVSDIRWNDSTQEWEVGVNACTHPMDYLEIFTRLGLKGAPLFHCYTPEQLTAFLNDRTFLNMISGREIHLSTKELKYNFYSSHFPLEKREKYHGFEQIMDIDSIYRKKLSALYDRKLPAYKRVYRTYQETLSLLKGQHSL